MQQRTMAFLWAVVPNKYMNFVIFVCALAHAPTPQSHSHSFCVCPEPNLVRVPILQRIETKIGNDKLRRAAQRHR